MDTTAAPNPNTGEDTAIPTRSPTMILKTDLGEDSDHPLVLRRQLSLETDHSVWIICSKPMLMHINYAPDPESAIWESAHTITIDASTPFRVSASEAITIEPKGELGEAFAKGWEKLVEELKLHVLTPLLIPDGQIPPPWIETDLAPAIDYELWNFPLARSTLFRYLLCSKNEIAYLVKETFYGQNTFRVGCNWISVQGGNMTTHPGYFLRPLPPIAAHLRKIQYVMDLTRTEWKTLNDLAVKMYGFEKVRRVDVIVHLDFAKHDEDDWTWPGIMGSSMSWMGKARELVRTQIVFHCNGSLGVYVPGEDYPQVVMAKSQVRDVEKTLRSAIEFKPMKDTETGKRRANVIRIPLN
jgi:hypothetical protein